MDDDDEVASLSAEHHATSSKRISSPIHQGRATTAKLTVEPDAPVNRPPGSRFHQQKLPAWQPLITAGTVFPLFLVLALAFIGIGFFLIWANTSIAEVSIDYTHCNKAFEPEPIDCASLAVLPAFYGNYSVCTCRLDFTLGKPMHGLVYAYYGLTNFHQNHRKYVKSYDGLQLSGRRTTNLDAECSPYRRDEATGNWIAPCGTVANSLFNDTFQLLRHLPNNTGLETVPWTSEGISWSADVARKFAKVNDWNGTAKPPSWPRTMSQRSPEGYAKDEELQVWLSVAALPSFRKLHRRVNHESGTNYFGGLPSGNYTLVVNYSYPVAAFGGSKSFVLSTAGFLGGKNAGLGGLSIAVGCLHLALSCVFAVMHFYAKRSRKADPYYGIAPKERLLLEAMTSGTSPPRNGSDEDDCEDLDDSGQGRGRSHAYS